MAETISKHAAKTPPSAPGVRVPIEYVTAREAATFTGLGLPTLIAMRNANIGPAFVRVSARRVVYELAALRDYMANRTVTTQSIQKKR
jgi:predicted DNA-binding transcriptional regulator AlpA